MSYITFYLYNVSFLIFLPFAFCLLPFAFCLYLDHCQAVEGAEATSVAQP